MATYSIESIQTKFYIISDGTEQPGDLVTSLDGSVCVPPNTTLTFSSALNGPVVQTTIRGKAGLYAAPGTGTSLLIWSPGSYTWQVGRTSGGTYQIYPATGENLYWFQNAQSQSNIDLYPGSSAQESEIFFVIS